MTLNANILTQIIKMMVLIFFGAHIWTSETARDNCWENWGENYKSSWDSTINGIMSYDLIMFICLTNFGKQPKMQNDMDLL
ncbi:MAG: hypothetical protein Ct9H90mP3_8600 [Flammeovirgaceae bacterium]|nr:MAG: hypothetical protein Ct9H90mP3_8600 [Flammeovirgaceae bacterium]